MPTKRTGHFISWADTRLFFRTFEPDGDAVGTFLYVHGYAEHSGRYADLIDEVLSAGWRCAGFDHRGHGNSEGMSGYILRFRHLVYDVEAFVNHVRSYFPSGPVVVYGHSAGATATIRYAADHQDELAGIVLSSMYLKNGEPVSPMLILAARFLNTFVPTVGVKPHDVPHLSRDREVVADFLSDSLNYTGNVRVRTGLELISSYKKVLAIAPQITIPVLMQHGTGDRIADPSTTSEVFKLLASERKELKLYEGLYHELIHEPESEQVIADIVSWLDQLVK